DLVGDAVQQVAAGPRTLARPRVRRLVRGRDRTLRVLAVALLDDADGLSGRGRRRLEDVLRRRPGAVDEHHAPRGVSSSIVTRMRSRMETIPTGRPPSSTTGRCLKPPWIMIDAAKPVESVPSTVSGSRVIHAPTTASST